MTGAAFRKTVWLHCNILLLQSHKGNKIHLYMKQKKQLEELGFDNLPICVAKTQYSFSDDPTLLGAPEGFTLTVRNLKVSAGAGFIVALTGDIMSR